MAFDASSATLEEDKSIPKPKAAKFDPSTAFDESSATLTDDTHTTPGGMAASAARGMGPVAAGALAGAAIGAPFAGVGAVPGAAIGAGAAGLTQIALSLYNPIAKKMGLPEAVTPQEATDKLFDLAGIQRPTTAAERTAETTAAGAAGAGGLARGAGEVAGSLTGTTKGVAEKLAASPGAQTLSGATSGASAQTAAEHGAGPVGQLAAGLAGGMAPYVAGRTAATAIAPQVSSDVRTLLDAGVELTPGQMAQGKALNIPKRMEETAKSIPLAGAFPRSAESQAVDTFNRATANQALAPLGVAIPKGVSGRSIIDMGQQILSDAYDTVVPHLKLQSDPALDADLLALEQTAQKELPKPMQDQLQGILDNRLHFRTGRGAMDGATIKQMQSELTHLSRTYRSSSDAAQRQMSGLLEEANQAVREALERQNPNQTDRLRQIDQAYAMFVRVENAAARRASGEGRFTPGDLLAAIKQADRSVRSRSFSRGDALLQDWGETANRVISNKLPDSGTTERALGVGGIAALAQNHPVVAAGMAASVVPYTAPGMAATRWLASPGPMRSAAGNALRVPPPASALVGTSGLFTTSPDDRLSGATNGMQ